jgi:hypothetical protein
MFHRDHGNTWPLTHKLYFTRRGVVVVMIIALHLFVVWALASGSRKMVEVIAPNIEADIVEEVKNDEEPPPPPPPEMDVRRSSRAGSVDRPSMETTTTAIRDVTDKPPPPAPPPPPRVAGSPAKMKSAVDPDQFYPPGAKRREEQGSPVVQAERLSRAQARRHRNFGLPGARRCRGQSQRPTAIRLPVKWHGAAGILRQVQGQVRH